MTANPVKSRIPAIFWAEFFEAKKRDFIDDKVIFGQKMIFGQWDGKNLAAFSYFWYITKNGFRKSQVLYENLLSEIFMGGVKDEGEVYKGMKGAAAPASGGFDAGKQAINQTK